MENESKASVAERQTTATGHTANWKQVLLLSALVLALGAGVTVLIFTTEPKAKREGAMKKTAMLVEVVPAEHGSFHPDIVVTGTVQAAQDIVLSPRVAGKVMGHAPEFVPGGFVEKGNVLLRLDSSDYENQVQQRRGDLSQAMADLHLEQGRQRIAAEEFGTLFKEPMSEDDKSLVLRKPQLAAAKMRVDAAEAAVTQARLDLQRTTVKAPFTAQVLTRDVNVGSQVAPGDSLARLVGVETYWVMASVPLSKRPWLVFGSGKEQTKGSLVKIRNRGVWAEGISREGRLDRLIGVLDEQTRMARVIITIDDPLARSEAVDGPPLIVGEFVEASIVGKQVSDVVRVRRDHIRKNDTVWVMRNDKLEIRETKVVLRDASYAYVSQGIQGGEGIVTTNLSTVTEGAKLRVAASGSER